MSPVNHDPSNDVSEERTKPLTRREIRARERFLETQNQEVLPPPVPVHIEAPAAEEPARQYAAHGASGAPLQEHQDAAAVPQAPVRGPEPAAEEPGPVEAARVEPVPEASAPVEGAADEIHPATVHDEDLLQAANEAHPATAHFAAVHPDEASHPDAIHPDELHSFEAVPGDEFHDFPAHDDGLGHEFPEHQDPQHQDPVFYEVHDENDPHSIMAAATPVPKAASKKVRRRRRLLALLLTLAVFVAAVTVGAQFLKPLLGMDKVTDYPGPGTGSVTVTVAPGSGPKAVANQLQAQHVVANADSFLSAFSAAGGELSPGDFTFKTEMKNSDAVNILLNKDASKVMYFALSAGLRIGESLDAIAQGSGIPVSELTALSNSPAQFGVPSQAKNLEGFLAPGEYRFPLGTSGKDILQKLVSSTLDELKAQGVTDPVKQYQTITVASIVQAEGGQADYGNVAGAIYNRLKPGNTETAGLIQSDATVTYGLGTKTLHLTDAEKADKSNPYNTYANVGLPVGPIGSPGKTAIDAAAKPTQNNYLYWVTINLDTKETKFSSTLAEHLKYVDQYNAWCAANPGRCV